MDGGLTCDLFLDIVPARPNASFENLHLSPPRQLAFNQWSSCEKVEQLPLFMDMGILTAPSDRVSATITQSHNAENTIVTFTSSPDAEVMTQSQNAGNSFVMSPPVSGIVTQDPGNTVTMSSPVTGTVTHVESISITSSPVAETGIQKVTAVLGIPKTSVSPSSDYLVYPVQKITPTTPKRSVPRARVLTSDESLALLEQKENAKEMALLEKEKRKIERAEKKQKREESLQQKKEQRARKAEEKARKQQEKAKRQPSTG